MIIRKKLFYLKTLGVLLVLLLIFGIGRIVMKPRLDAKISFVLPPEYYNLFNEKAKEELILKETYLIKGRNPVSVLTYKKRYSLLVFSLDVDFTKTLREIVDKKNPDVRRPFNGFSSINIPNLRFFWTYDSISVANHVEISYSGELLKYTFGNDTILSSRIDLNGIYFGSNHDRISNFFVEKNTIVSAKVPIELITIKTGGRLNFIVVSQIDGKGEIETQLPYSILKIS